MHQKEWLKHPLAVGAIATLCCALWASAFPCVKIGYVLFDITGTAQQILFAGMRFTLAGILTILIGSAMRRRWLFPRKNAWGYVLKLSFFQTFLQYIFFYIGLALTTGVKASIIEGTCAFFAMLIASLFFRQERLTPMKIIACIIGFSGVALVNLNADALSGSLLGDGMIFISTVSYAISSVLIKKYAAYEDPVVLSGYQFTIGGIAMLVCGFAAGGQMLRFTPQAAGILLYLGFLSAVAYSLWGILLKYNAVSKVTIYSFMIPPFGVLLSALLLHEQTFGLKGIAALVLVCSGILIINRQSGK